MALSLKDWIKQRLQSMTTRPGMWAKAPEALEASVLHLLEVYHYDPEHPEPPREGHRLDNVLNRYMHFTRGMKGKPNNVPLSCRMTLDELAPVLQQFVEKETSSA